MGGAVSDPDYGTVPETVLQVRDRVVKQAMHEIVYPTLMAGGDIEAVLLVLESVVTGVLSVAIRLGEDDAVLDVLQGRVRRRMAEIRLSGLVMAGHA